MQKLRTLTTILFLSMILIGMISCEVSRHTENGEHHRRGMFHRHDRHDEDHPKAVIVIDNDHR